MAITIQRRPHLPSLIQSTHNCKSLQFKLFDDPILTPESLPAEFCSVIWAPAGQLWECKNTPWDSICGIESCSTVPISHQLTFQINFKLLIKHPHLHKTKNSKS